MLNDPARGLSPQLTTNALDAIHHTLNAISAPAAPEPARRHAHEHEYIAPAPRPDNEHPQPPRYVAFRPLHPPASQKGILQASLARPVPLCIPFTTIRIPVILVITGPDSSFHPSGPALYPNSTKS
ncbi:hypothetical protein L198_01984 [Cryptococcus wingfieldii CBS 7118]|uniref:Uncharacterized protein n=1 Tax=Cryptococcus wingfieldii CBS 7118 TaxID=1295528 RepID=A0A1E3JZG1_9TREE|nr:hypothetical protein L198_01984 [Cryptococcus wingfieldii CBS 7118]ODO05292.1 hypothetical protein L198_01984 [Cryptococcus wingfieldii CBS 7118]